MLAASEGAVEVVVDTVRDTSLVEAQIRGAVCPALVRPVDCRMVGLAGRHNWAGLLAGAEPGLNLFFGCVVHHLDVEHCENWAVKQTSPGA